jgi:hypothetical protein
MTRIPDTVQVPVLDNPGGCEYSSDGDPKHAWTEIRCTVESAVKKLGVLNELGRQSDSGTP